MATGIPGNNGNKSSSGRAFRLEYEGKADPEEVLSSPSGKFQRALLIEGKPTNRLMYGDNLAALRCLSEDPSILGHVRLIYIDPPYATRSRFESRSQVHAYEDSLWGADYLEFLRRRLILMRELLADDGSIYVHLDDNMAFAAKIILDEVFGATNFRNCITRKKCNPKNYARRQYGNVADFILFYSKTRDCVWNQPRHELEQEWLKREYPYIEPSTGRRFKKVPIHAPGVRNGASGKQWRGMDPPPGKHWQYVPSTLDEMDRRGEIFWSVNGNPRRKVFADDVQGPAVQDIWLDCRDAHNQNIRITGYPTEKNPDLIKRIILASSNPGDLVLDAFGGSGTTGAVAEDAGREWILIDNSLAAIETMVWRLARGTEPMGDFVSQRLDRPARTNKPIRVLKSGLSIELDSQLGTVPQEQVDEWRVLLEEPVAEDNDAGAVLF